MKHLTFLLLLCLGTTSLAKAVNGTDEVLEWQFRVFLNDKAIGYHEFRVENVNETQRVVTEASFDVKILFINAYRYRHRNVEIWDQNCLINIDAETDANGKRQIVNGSTEAGKFLVDTGNRQEILSGCIKSFAYWNPAFLAEDRLLNSQTGNLEAVVVTVQGQELIDVNGTSVLADRYQISVNNAPITLWYATDDQRWLALASSVGGRDLRYQPVRIPSPNLSKAIETAKFDSV